MDPQREMIIRLRKLCQEDKTLIAAMLYGSWARDEADRYSDIDCILFFADDKIEEVDLKTWLSQIAPIELFYRNEFGNWVSIFENFVRGEFHFYKNSEMGVTDDWHGIDKFHSLESTLLVDRTGELTDRLQGFIGPPQDHNSEEDVVFLRNSFLNWILFGSNVYARGEFARSLEILHLVQDYLLRMVRVLEGTSHHWITPTKALEKEISKSAYNKFQECTSKLDPDHLRDSYSFTWQWGIQMSQLLSDQHSLPSYGKFIDKLEAHIQKNLDQK